MRATKTGASKSALYSKHWPCLFPQHGPGKKHTGRFALEPWQQALVDQATEEFILRPDPQRRLPRRRQRSRRRQASATTSRTCPRTSTGSSPPHSTPSAFRGRGRARNRVHLPQGRDRPPGRVRRAKGPRGTVGWCPLHGVGDRRSSRW